MSVATRVGRYWLFPPFASGGMASVHLGCLDSEAGPRRPVAIKRLHVALADDGVRSMFRREARIAMRLRHPNAVPVLESFSEGETSYLVMDYVHGVSLSELIVQDLKSPRREIDEAVAVRIAVDALEGLHAAHTLKDENGAPLMVVHRDVSPQNIMISTTGVVSIVDFGVAKVRDATRVTEEGVFHGKLSYASPEQFGKGRVDQRTDIRAIGVVLWEMIAGRRMIGSKEVPAIISQVLTVDPDPVSLSHACTPALEAVIMKALARDPDARYSSAREMAIALEKAVTPASQRALGRLVLAKCRAAIDRRDDALAVLHQTDISHQHVAVSVPVTEPVSPLSQRAIEHERPRVPRVLLGVSAAFGLMMTVAVLLGVRAWLSRAAATGPAASSATRAQEAATVPSKGPPDSMPQSRDTFPAPSGPSATSVASTTTQHSTPMSHATGVARRPATVRSATTAKPDPLEAHERK
jgi:serine/threonine-protein kinase